MLTGHGLIAHLTIRHPHAVLDLLMNVAGTFMVIAKTKPNAKLLDNVMTGNFTPDIVIMG